jgi:hypothetical protein
MTVSVSTSSSRAVSMANCSGWPAGAGAVPTKWAISRRVTLGRGDRFAGNRPYGGEQVVGERVLEQEAAGAGPQRGEHVFVQVEGRQDEHPGSAVAVDAARIRRVASMPSMPDMRMSIRTTCGRVR